MESFENDGMFATFVCCVLKRKRTSVNRALKIKHMSEWLQKVGLKYHF